MLIVSPTVFVFYLVFRVYGFGFFTVLVVCICVALSINVIGFVCIRLTNLIK